MRYDPTIKQDYIPNPKFNHKHTEYTMQIEAGKNDNIVYWWIRCIECREYLMVDMDKLEQTRWADVNYITQPLYRLKE